MSNPVTLLQCLLQPINSLIVRLLIMGLGFLHVALLMWEPTAYANMIGGFNFIKAILLIWAMCSSMVVGVGFTPYKTAFKLMFNPYISLLILVIYTSLIIVSR